MSESGTILHERSIDIFPVPLVERGGKHEKIARPRRAYVRQPLKHSVAEGLLARNDVRADRDLRLEPFHPDNGMCFISLRRRWIPP